MTARKVYTAEQLDHFAEESEWPDERHAYEQAAAQARVIEKLKAWLPTLRDQPHSPTVGQVQRKLDELLTEEGLA